MKYDVKHVGVESIIEPPFTISITKKKSSNNLFHFNAM